MNPMWRLALFYLLSCSYAIPTKHEPSTSNSIEVFPSGRGKKLTRLSNINDEIEEYDDTVAVPGQNLDFNSLLRMVPTVLRALQSDNSNSKDKFFFSQSSEDSFRDSSATSSDSSSSEALFNFPRLNRTWLEVATGEAHGIVNFKNFTTYIMNLNATRLSDIFTTYFNNLTTVIQDTVPIPTTCQDALLAGNTELIALLASLATFQFTATQITDLSNILISRFSALTTCLLDFITANPSLAIGADTIKLLLADFEKAFTDMITNLAATIVSSVASPGSSSTSVNSDSSFSSSSSSSG